jgi:BlaI family transcriptional regulator, penicillinase repressor
VDVMAGDVFFTCCRTCTPSAPNSLPRVLKVLPATDAIGVENGYRPLVSEEDCLRVESESFLERCFDGAVQPLLAHFARRQKLTLKDLDRLRRILESKEP